MNNKEPLVSVILLSYNHCDFLRRAIESVVKQTYMNLEIIISDDCSSDNSVNIINEFTDSRIVKIVNKKNLGAVTNNNNALRLASGKYIAILNSDDYWDKRKIELQVKFLEENNEYGAVFSRAYIVNENNIIIKKSKYFDVSIFDQDNRSRTAWIRKLFYEQNCLCHPSVLIRRELYFKTELYNPLLKQLPDYKMWIDIIKLTNIFIIQEKLVYYRVLQNAKNTSSNYGDNIIRHNNEFILIMRNYFENMKKQDFIGSFKKDFIRKDAISDIELQIEQAFLYIKMQGEVGFLYYSIAIEKLYLLMQDNISKDVLFKKYNFDYNDFFELTGVTGYTSISKYNLYKKDEMSTIDKIMYILKKIKKYI